MLASFHLRRAPRGSAMNGQDRRFANQPSDQPWCGAGAAARCRNLSGLRITYSRAGGRGQSVVRRHQIGVAVRVVERDRSSPPTASM